jgi:hypothetical protein
MTHVPQKVIQGVSGDASIFHVVCGLESSQIGLHNLRVVIQPAIPFTSVIIISKFLVSYYILALFIRLEMNFHEFSITFLVFSMHDVLGFFS